MCTLGYVNGTERVWIRGDDEIRTRPVIRISAIKRHCDLRMAVTETHYHCRRPCCDHSEFRWRVADAE